MIQCSRASIILSIIVLNSTFFSFLSRKSPNYETTVNELHALCLVLAYKETKEALETGLGPFLVSFVTVFFSFFFFFLFSRKTSIIGKRRVSSGSNFGTSQYYY